ncbi:hypothetical protein BDFB_013054 [Asbolus verrucosus]|uniref:DDE 3 domain containing protein n=1 Tax=Asbolus verrucosus TaxID=1661398 RepID=A0A482VJJ0_ASBVE|nr:hypothetical protein BDFB_013054 [Asbolus verrucosus]
MIWPSRSPDCSPIDHVWLRLELQLACRDVQPINFIQLGNALVEEWALLPQEFIILKQRGCLEDA